MKITICGSLTFAKQMLETKERLEKMGHEAIVPTDTQMCLENPKHIDDLDADYKHCIENDIMRTHFKLVEKADAVLVLNHKKNNIEGYVGTATMMDLAIAHFFGKKIFLLNDLPNPKGARWAHEARVMQPKIIKGDLAKIK